MKKICIFLMLVVVGAMAAEKTFSPPISKMTVRVIGEDGGPISGATVRFGFSSGALKWGGGEVVNVTGPSDSNGKFSGEGYSFDRMNAQIEKDGYYVGWSKSFKFTEAVMGKWQPWNPTVDVVLKKKINPIPMYAKSINIGMPAFGSPIGYDLVFGDWIQPYGKGKNSDVFFTAELNQRSERDFDYKLVISFPNKGDGIQPFVGDDTSSLKSLKVAPENGYKPEWIQARSRKPEKPEESNRDDKRNYYLRLRTVLDDQGNVVSAVYGKIYGDFMDFTYYLNPTPNDRNMEFDLKRNLLKDLPRSEMPRTP